MKEEHVHFFKQLLNEQLKELLGQADLTVRDLVDNNERSADLLDLANFDYERGTMLRIRDRESKLIRKIQRALENIEDGNYGICEVCEEEIAIERLKARPVTTYCIHCKTKMEAMER